MVSIQDVFAARKKMKGIVHETPLDYSRTFSEFTNNEVYLKLENLQKTGSFKVRGSYNKIMSLSEAELRKGVIAASAGNHAQGVAYSSSMLQIPCTIVMPKGAPLSKIAATKGYGAKVELQGNVFDEALAYALQLKERTGATFVHAFDDAAIIAGQGTVGLEILEGIPDVEVVLCPAGGGGLLAGVALAIKEQKPSVKVYGVQAIACPSIKKSWDEKQVTTVDALPTMADGIAVRRPGELTFQLIQKYVDDIVTVDEMEIARTMLMVLERSKLLVEGSGASALAALLYKKLPIEGKKIAVILSGGNVDVNVIARIIERGMVEAGRFVHFSTTLPDKPGQLQRVLQIIAEAGANVLNVQHERIGMKVFPGYAELHLSLETKDQAHIDQVFEKLQQKGYCIQMIE